MQVSLYDEQITCALECFNFITENLNKSTSIRLRAPAGVGKTHTIRNVIRILSGFGIKIQAAALANRAARQLEKEGWVEAGTIHSLMYDAILDENDDLIGWKKKTNAEIRGLVDALCIDEASMLNHTIACDLMKIGIPIIFIGDHKQLPSITGKDDKIGNYNILTDDIVDKNVTHKHIISLETNRRTDTSQLGIISLMAHLRENDSIPRRAMAGVKYCKKSQVLNGTYADYGKHDMIICGTNKTRKKINTFVRNSLGFHGVKPEIGERIMCLKNNIVNNITIANGDLYTVQGRVDMGDSSLYMIESEFGEKVTVEILDSSFEKETPPPKKKDPDDKNFGFFTYGYCGSCHKLQGSSVNDVLFVDEHVGYFLDQQKFRYTAVSRAAKELTIAI